MNFILRIPKEIKWKAEVVLLKVTLMNSSSDIQGYQMEGESGVTRSIIDELHSSEIQQDQMEGASGVIRSVIDELHSGDIQGDQVEGESGVT